jgi:DNA-directed RNA polymerase subunit RPC12/RpoP
MTSDPIARLLEIYVQSCLDCGKGLLVEDDFDGYIVCKKCGDKRGI